MARSKGLMKVEGTLDGITFYKSKDGNLVRMKGGVARNRIATDSAFSRTRENMSEFKEAASAGKLFRAALRVLTSNTGDSRLIPRKVKLMHQVKNMDGVSARGERLVAVGLVTPAGKELLKGLDFNPQAVLGTVLHKAYSVDTPTGKIDIANLLAANDVAFPAGATHVSFKGSFAKIDFAAGLHELQLTNTVTIAKDSAAASISLVPPAVPALANSVSIIVLGWTSCRK